KTGSREAFWGPDRVRIRSDPAVSARIRAVDHAQDVCPRPASARGEGKGEGSAPRERALSGGSVDRRTVCLPHPHRRHYAGAAPVPYPLPAQTRGEGKNPVRHRNLGIRPLSAIRGDPPGTDPYPSKCAMTSSSRWVDSMIG